MTTPSEILTFWFDSVDDHHWFVRDERVDAEIRRRFLSLYERAAAGWHDGWRDSVDAGLALIVVLDQFPRNLFRESARAFATDAKARSVARIALARGHDMAVPIRRRQFFYLPFEHSENMADQDLCVRLARERIAEEKFIDFARRHREAIRNYGRFPGRNRALGRMSTPAEVAYLADRKDGF